MNLPYRKKSPHINYIPNSMKGKSNMDADTSTVAY
jgi:hypothetical protein